MVHSKGRSNEPAHAEVFGKKTDSVRKRFARAAVWVIPPDDDAPRKFPVPNQQTLESRGFEADLEVGARFRCRSEQTVATHDTG